MKNYLKSLKMLVNLRLKCFEELLKLKNGAFPPKTPFQTRPTHAKHNPDAATFMEVAQ